MSGKKSNMQSMWQDWQVCVFCEDVRRGTNETLNDKPRNIIQSISKSHFPY
jgi:hypothetical protein